MFQILMLYPIQLISSLMKAKGGIFALNDSDEGKSRDLKHFGCTKNMKKHLVMKY